MKKLVSLLVLVLAVGNTMATMQITEWMYKGTDGEFVEFTNIGSAAIDMTGWSYADSDATAGDVDLSGFGTVAAGESVILTEADASVFRAAWGLGSSVKIIGGNSTDNLGNGDMINIYNGSTLIDSLTYVKDVSPKTDSKSCTIPQADFALTTAPSGWALSAVGDINNSWASTSGDIGNPGYNNYTIPEPATIFIFSAAAAILRFRKK